MFEILPESTESCIGFKISGEVETEDYEMLRHLPFEPKMIELVGWDEKLGDEIRSWFPQSLLCQRFTFGSQFQKNLLQYAHSGIRVFHLVANYHGRGANGEFVLELIRQAHRTFVDASCRDEVTLLGSGGIIAAEHVPKAIICGLDAVALDTVLLMALQTRLIGEGTDQATSQWQLAKRITAEWGIQRVKNLLASWRDQMLEVLGAMGLREVRRLRGEVGRAMFQKDLEHEAFRGISGYEDN